MIQSGSLGLVHAVRKLDYEKLKDSEDMEETDPELIDKIRDKLVEGPENT